MDASTQRMQAYALIDALPQDYLEIVMALMRKLVDDKTQSAQETNLANLSTSQKASLDKVRKIAGCFSECQSDDWKNEKSSSLHCNIFQLSLPTQM